MKNVMTRAWEMYKNTGCTTKAEFSLALKAAWAEYKANKNEKTIEEKLYEIGGRYWAKGGHERIYVPCDYAEKVIGLDIDYRKSGSVCFASLEGKKISNSHGSEIAAAVDGIYYNIVDGLFYRRNHKYSDYADAVVSAIKAA